jgi:DHA1 family tetracycline resistance protein-like MFS transporter
LSDGVARTMNSAVTASVPSTIPEKQQAERQQASLLPIFLIVLVDVLGLSIVLPLLAVYAETFGASAQMAALLVPVYSACQAVAGPMLGALSDRIGRKRVLLISQAGTLIGFLCIAGAGSLAMIFVGRILDGLTAGNLSVAQAYIADNTDTKNRARSLALIGIAFGVGFLLGPALTAALLRFGMSVPLYLAAGLSLTSILCTSTLLPRDGRQPEHKSAQADLTGMPGGKRLGLLSWHRYPAYFRRPVLGGVLIEFFLYQMAFYMFISGFALFAERRFTWHGHPFTPREIGWLYAFSGFLGILVQGGLLGRLVRVFKEPKLISVGLLALGAGYALLGYVEPVGSLLVAVALSSIGQSFLRPCLTSITTQLAGRQEQGVVLGLTQTLASLASVMAGYLSGLLIELRLLTAWGWTAAAFCGAALLVSRFGSATHVEAA